MHHPRIVVHEILKTRRKRRDILRVGDSGETGTKQFFDCDEVSAIIIAVEESSDVASVIELVDEPSTCGCGGLTRGKFQPNQLFADSFAQKGHGFLQILEELLVNGVVVVIEFYEIVADFVGRSHSLYIKLPLRRQELLQLRCREYIRRCFFQSKSIAEQFPNKIERLFAFVFRSVKIVCQIEEGTEFVLIPENNLSYVLCLRLSHTSKTLFLCLFFLLSFLPGWPCFFGTVKRFLS